MAYPSARLSHRHSNKAGPAKRSTTTNEGHRAAPGKRNACTYVTSHEFVKLLSSSRKPIDEYLQLFGTQCTKLPPPPAKIQPSMLTAQPGNSS